MMGQTYSGRFEISDAEHADSGKPAREFRKKQPKRQDQFWEMFLTENARAQRLGRQISNGITWNNKSTKTLWEQNFPRW